MCVFVSKLIAREPKKGFFCVQEYGSIIFEIFKENY